MFTCLDLILDEEVVQRDANPAASEDQYGEEYLLNEVKRFFPDVEYTPDCGDDTEDVDYFSYHNKLVVKCYLGLFLIFSKFLDCGDARGIFLFYEGQEIGICLVEARAELFGEVPGGFVELCE